MPYWINTLFHSSLLAPMDPEHNEITLDFILECYSEPHRFYHTIPHLESMSELAFFNLKKLVDMDTFTDIVTAILFHDLVYDPHRQDNEEESVKLFLKILKEHKRSIPEVRVEKVKSLILSTKPCEGQVPTLLTDLDLAVFTSRRPIYRRYALDIRREYMFVEPMEYLKGRNKVLQTFLGLPQIYTGQMDLFTYKGSLEQKARENLQWEMEELHSLV